MKANKENSSTNKNLILANVPSPGNFSRASSQVPTSLVEQLFTRCEKENSWDQMFEALDEKSDEMFGDMSKDCAREPENKDLNRYPKYVPYDHSRVKLSTKSNDYINANLVLCTLPQSKTAADPSSKTQKYIVTQGPLPITCPDFWAMIRENKVEIITMLCNVVEDGKNKCAQYFPSVTPPLTTPELVDSEMPLIFGTGTRDHDSMNYTEVGVKINFRRQFVVSPSQEKARASPKSPDSKNNDYLIRELELAWEKDKLTVFHCHYLAWPDFGVPDVTSFMRYMKTIRAIEKELSEKQGGTKEESKPWVVHCSAGVGRSGTLVLIDACLRILEMNSSLDAINIPNLVLEMRKYRKGMIQTADQLKFAFLVILQAYNEIKHDVAPKSPIEKAVAPVKKEHKPDTHKEKIKTEFSKDSSPASKSVKVEDSPAKDNVNAHFLKKIKALEDMIKVNDAKKEWPNILKKLDEETAKSTKKPITSSGSSPENKPKNRDYETVPNDEERIFLKYKLPNDYINASNIFIKPLKRMYILAQSPLEGTWEEFLMMCWEQECSMIVMLSHPKEEVKDFCFQYWPTDDPFLSTEDFKHSKDAKNLEKASFFKEFNNKLFKIVNKGLKYFSEAYEIRNLEIVDIKNKSSQPIIHMILKAWPVTYTEFEKSTDPIKLSANILDFYLAYIETGIFISLKGNVVVHGNRVNDRPTVFILLDVYLCLTKKTQEPLKFPKLNMLTEARVWRKGLLDDPQALRFLFIIFKELSKLLINNWVLGEVQHTPTGVESLNLDSLLIQSTYKKRSKESLLEKAQSGKLKSILMIKLTEEEKPEGTPEDKVAELETDDKSRPSSPEAGIAVDVIKDSVKIEEGSNEAADKSKTQPVKSDEALKGTKSDENSVLSSNKSSNRSVPTPSDSVPSSKSDTSSSSFSSSNKVPSRKTSKSLYNPSSKSRSNISSSVSSRSSNEGKPSHPHSTKTRSPTSSKASGPYIIPSVLHKKNISTANSGLLDYNILKNHPKSYTSTSTQTGGSLTAVDPSYLAYLNMELEDEKDKFLKP